MSKSVAVIILNYNTPVNTANCVKSFFACCDNKLFDIIVADNGSSDNSLQTLRGQFPEVLFLDNKQNLGFAEGNNIALAYSISHLYEYSLLANSDTLVEEDIVTTLKTHLDLNRTVAAVQPAIYWMHEKNKLWNGPGYFNKLTGNTISKTYARYKFVSRFLKVEWVTGCCVMLKNKAVKETGGFNKNFFLYYEDADLSFRLRNCNYDLHYITTAKMYHEAGVSGKKVSEEGFLNPIIHYYTIRNHFWFIRKYSYKLFLPINMIYNLSYYAVLWLYFTVRNRTQKAYFVSKGIKQGLFTQKKSIWDDLL